MCSVTRWFYLIHRMASGCRLLVGVESWVHQVMQYTTSDIIETLDSNITRRCPIGLSRRCSCEPGQVRFHGCRGKNITRFIKIPNIARSLLKKQEHWDSVSCQGGGTMGLFPERFAWHCNCEPPTCWPFAWGALAPMAPVELEQVPGCFCGSSAWFHAQEHRFLRVPSSIIYFVSIDPSVFSSPFVDLHIGSYTTQIYEGISSLEGEKQTQTATQDPRKHTDTCMSCFSDFFEHT